MASNTLNNRSTGQTILDTFFNDIHNALDGDFVGRGATGIPTAGQNLGTLPLPWGPVYCSSLNIGGSNLDTSKIVSPPNRVVSGKTRVSSNQPAFITPNGAAASLIVAGASTNLVLSIGGVAVTVNTDITKGSLSLAPSSNNTATVNDSTASGQADTKQWGEYFAKKITVSSAGSNITALVGKFAAFKIVHSGVTEYFTAYVESSTVLSHCMRGFFYDSSLNPINATVISNSDTITLMKAGFVFMTNDGTTVDVSYTFPVWGASAPNSPVTGDYWYDMVNNIWKRYDGASFQIVNRTLIGISVQDSTNCVAARSIDFYKAYSPVNTIDLEVTSSATIIQAKRQFQAANVAGNDIQFEETLQSWVGANNYVTSTDYYATFTTGTVYYLYLTDQGAPKISDIPPYYRPDLYGWYSRHNPWRCVGIAITDGSSNWTWVVSPDSEYSELNLDTGNGFGATATTVRRFTSTRINVGVDMTYTDDSNLGGIVRVNTEGDYFIKFEDKSSAGSFQTGITVNSSALTTAAFSITYAQGRRALGEGANGFVSPCSTIVHLMPGDLIRAQGDGSANDTSDNVSLHIKRLRRS